PLGQFAGVAPVELGLRAAVHWSGLHRAVARPDDRFIAEHTALAERELPVLQKAAVVTNPLGYARGGRWVLPCARVEHGRIWDVEIDLSDPVRVAIEQASSPINFNDLAYRLTETLRGGVVGAERLLAALVNAGVLLSAVRPSMTVTDPSTHMTRFLAGRIDLPDPGDRTAVDLRVGCSVSLPPAVVAAAEDAATALAAVAPRLPGWAAYHRAFVERWGPGAAVPLRGVVAVLGFPAGYRGSPLGVRAMTTLLCDPHLQRALVSSWPMSRSQRCAAMTTGRRSRTPSCGSLLPPRRRRTWTGAVSP